MIYLLDLPPPEKNEIYTHTTRDTHTYTYTHTHTHTHTHTYTHIHTHTHTHVHSCSMTHAHVHSCCMTHAPFSTSRDNPVTSQGQLSSVLRSEQSHVNGITFSMIQSKTAHNLFLLSLPATISCMPTCIPICAHIIPMQAYSVVRLRHHQSNSNKPRDNKSKV